MATDPFAPALMRASMGASYATGFTSLYLLAYLKLSGYLNRSAPGGG